MQPGPSGIRPYAIGAATALTCLLCFAWPPLRRLGQASPLRVLRRDAPLENRRTLGDYALGLLAVTLLAGLRGAKASRWTVVVLPIAWFAAGLIGLYAGVDFELSRASVLALGFTNVPGVNGSSPSPARRRCTAPS